MTGVLTKTQREYLCGEYEPPTDNAEDQMRFKIRSRILTALKDLELANEQLGEKDLALIMEQTETDVSLVDLVGKHG